MEVTVYHVYGHVSWGYSPPKKRSFTGDLQFSFLKGPKDLPSGKRIHHVQWTNPLCPWLFFHSYVTIYCTRGYLYETEDIDIVQVDDYIHTF